MKRKPIVVTGLGLICALGKSVDEAFENAKNGVSGIKKTVSINTDGCYADLAAEIPFFDETTDDADRTVCLALHAVREAVNEAKIDNFDEKTAVIFGSCIGGVRSGEKYYGGFPTRENALEMPIAPIAAKIAEELGAKGFVTNVANACAAGTMSISLACDLIEDGKADVAIVGGSDAFSSVPFSGFLALHALDGKGCSPFNRSEGITLGEGAGALVVESYEHAKKRGAKIYCYVLGSGITADAYDITAPRPDGEGQIRAINNALNDAKLNPADVGYVNAHGTGTKKNDEAELTSLNEIFLGTTVDVSSTKSMTGHCLGAAGAIEAVFCIKTLESGVILPTIGFEETEPNGSQENCSVNVVKNNAKIKQVSAVMNNSFAFGGTNASVIFAKNVKNQQSEKVDFKKKAVITGIGAATPFSKNLDEFLTIVGKDISAKQRVNYTTISNEELVNLGIKMPLYRKMDNLGKTVTAVGMAALNEGEYVVTDQNAFDTGIIVGTALGALGGECDFQKTIIDRGIKAGSPFKFPNTVYNAAGGHLSICSGIKGYNATVTNGAQSGLECIAIAKTEINRGRIKATLCIGADDGSETLTELYEKIGLLSRRADGDGICLSDGAAALLVEEKDNAIKRGAKIYCCILGCGKSHYGTPYGEFSVNIDGLLHAMRAATDDADVLPDEIGAVIGFGNGVTCYDEAEKAVIRKFFGKDVMVLSVKNSLGEGRAATAALGAVYGAAILSGKVNSIKGKNRNEIQNVMVISVATGGSCCAVILGKDEGK